MAYSDLAKRVLASLGAAFGAALGVLLLLAAIALPASAALGGDVASVQSDMVQMKASLRLTHAQAYTVHEMQMQHGTVKEYVSPSGKVFAVSWQGFFMPDMRQLLGSYFDHYTQAAARKQSPGRRPFVIHDSEMVLFSAGHMRSWMGQAYVPDLVPQGVNVDALQ
jgi:hypothetical protein